MNEAFFSSVRSSFGPLTQNQVDGCNALLKATEGLPLMHRAYVLATTWHETGPESSSLHMTPRREIWGPTTAQKGYEGRKDLGNTIPGDGKKFMGRGYVQITGRANYQKASNLVGKDLVANPDLAMEPDIAARIIVDGMTKGWFTGKKMSDYTSYRDMRRVVNGTDKADMIAGYADKFEKALRAESSVTPSPPVIPPVDDTPSPPNPPEFVPPPTNGADIAKWLLAIVGALFAAFAAWMIKE